MTTLDFQLAVLTGISVCALVIAVIAEHHLNMVN